MSDFKFKKKDNHVHSADLKGEFRKRAIVKKALSKVKKINDESTEQNNNNANDYAQTVIQEKTTEATESAVTGTVNAVRRKRAKNREQKRNQNSTTHHTADAGTNQQANQQYQYSTSQATGKNRSNRSRTAKNSSQKSRFKRNKTHGSPQNQNSMHSRRPVFNKKSTNSSSSLTYSHRISDTVRQFVSKKRKSATVAQSAKQSASAVKKVFSAIANAISKPAEAAGFGLLKYLFVLVVVFIIALVSALGSAFDRQDMLTNYDSAILSEEVIAYRPMVEHYASEHGIDEYVDILLAIMMQESSGLGTDPMQASEGEFNTRYPRTPNSIDDPEYSIQCGVQEFKKCLELAECTSSEDIAKLYIALQTYNYGPGYVDYAKRGGGYSEANASLYSEMMKRQLGVHVYGDPLYVSHVMRYANTGNGDIVAIALQEVGNTGGEKYWRWYGFNSHVEWCACFVSWCGNQAGLIEQGKMPKFSGCQVQGIRWFKDNNLWMNPEHTPKTGYLIFFDWDNDGHCEHVGIVEKVEGNTVYTIEGNSSNKCRQKSYRLTCEDIVGYGIIN